MRRRRKKRPCAPSHPLPRHLPSPTSPPIPARPHPGVTPLPRPRPPAALPDLRGFAGGLGQLLGELAQQAVGHGVLADVGLDGEHRHGAGRVGGGGEQRNGNRSGTGTCSGGGAVGRGGGGGGAFRASGAEPSRP